MEAPYETRLVDRLAEITNDSIAQGAGSLAVVGAASNEDCGNGVSPLNGVSVELDASHHGHMNVGDQTCGSGETRGSEEVGCRCEILDSITERSHEPSHGRATEFIIVNNRDEWWHTAPRSSCELAISSSSRPLTSSHYSRIPITWLTGYYRAISVRVNFGLRAVWGEPD
jgi:hypothetical protein